MIHRWSKKLMLLTSSTLTKELCYLEEIKILERHVLSTSPVAVECRLSELGQSMEGNHIILGNSLQFPVGETFRKKVAEYFNAE